MPVLFLLLSLMLAPLSHAASLGSLNLSSNLGEPLLAEVEVLLEPQESLSGLQAALASEQAYAKQGIRYQSHYLDLKVELQQNPQGLAVLKLSSSLPINEPYLDVLLQLDWAAGRLQKQYIVLLDPPQLTEAAPEAIVAPQASGEAVNTDDQLQAAMLPDQSSDQVDQARPLALVSKPGDTLSSLAKAIPQEGVSLDQMLLGLYQANPQAFEAGNMNRLKAGQALALPSPAELLATQAAAATAEVKLHASNWQAYRAALANKVLTQIARSDAVQAQSASGKIASAKDDAEKVKTTNNDVVKLSAGGKEAAKSADAKLMALQEDATAREKSLQESEARAQALQKQIQDMQQLLRLKNQSMADLQKHATEAKQANEAKQAEHKPKRAAWADWLVLSLTLLAIVAAFTWLSRSNKRRANLLDFKGQAIDGNQANLALEKQAQVQGQAKSQAKPEANLAGEALSAASDAPPVDLAGLDLNFTEPAVLQVMPAEQALPPSKAKAKKKTGLTSFIKTDANEVTAADGDMEVIRIDLSAISLDLSETEDELTLANAIAPSKKKPKATET
ncbi:Motility protein FimV, N-terminal [Methylophilaceae bacterium]|jgi:FimV-like protein